MKRKLTWLLATLAFAVAPLVMFYLLVTFPEAFLVAFVLALWGGSTYMIGVRLWDEYFKPATKPLPERKDRRRRSAVSP